jgi:PAS domain S-box-containing protein
MAVSNIRARLARVRTWAAMRRRVRPHRSPAGADLLQSLMDNIPDTIYFKDTASRFTRINRAQARVLGVRDPAEAIGKSDFDYQWKYIAQESFEREQEVIATGQPLIDSVEFNPTPSGEARWFSNTKAPIRDQAGRITGLVGISRDVTEHMQAQAALQAMRDSLETKVAARTRALRMLSECNQALVQADDETHLLHNVCDCIVEFGRYPLARVGFVEAGGRVGPAAQAGAADPGLGGELVALARAAAAAGRTMAVRNLHSDPALAPWRAQAQQQGFAAAIAIPFAVDGHLPGVLIIGSAEAAAFDSAETELLEELARDLAYGISTLKMRTALHRADELLRETSRLARVGGWELDVATQTVSWSEETYRIHEVDVGTRPDLAESINFYAPESRPTLTAAIERAMADGTPYELELPFITARGNRLWVRAQAQAELRDGRCVRLWGTFQDITARRQAEEQIGRNAARAEALSQISKALAAVSTNTAAVIDAAARLVADLIGDGCTIELASGSGPLFEPIAHHHRDPAAESALVELMAQLPPRVDEGVGGHVLRTGESQLIPTITLEQLHTVVQPAYWAYVDRYPISSLLCAPLRTEGGVIGVIALTRVPPAQPFTAADQSFLQELADRVALVITNARLYEELERRVAERTQWLEATNRELEAFSYSVSHDLRAPLRALDGFSLVLLEDYADKIDAQGRDYLRRVRAASNKMAELIDALLALAQVTRAPLREETVDLTALAEEIVADLRTGDPARQVETTIAPGLTTPGDARLLRGALENLLSNAWKFTGKTETPRIEVGTAPSLEPAKEAVFFVRDNGAGFDMAHADRLFGAFQRLHGQAEFAGIGIGLASVQRIIARHGGRVWAEGQPGQGATFYFALPIQ